MKVEKNITPLLQNKENEQNIKREQEKNTDKLTKRLYNKVVADAI